MATFISMFADMTYISLLKNFITNVYSIWSLITPAFPSPSDEAAAKASKIVFTSPTVVFEAVIELLLLNICSNIVPKSLLIISDLFP
jgi:hypothetical protein